MSMDQMNRRPNSVGEIAMQPYLNERKLAYSYESFTSGPNPDLLAQHPICGRVIFDVSEPRFRVHDLTVYFHPKNAVVS